MNFLRYSLIITNIDHLLSCSGTMRSVVILVLRLIILLHIVIVMSIPRVNCCSPPPRRNCIHGLLWHWVWWLLRCTHYMCLRPTWASIDGSGRLALGWLLLLLSLMLSGTAFMLSSHGSLIVWWLIIIGYSANFLMLQFVENKVELLTTFFAGVVIIIWGCASLAAPLLHIFYLLLFF